MPKSIEELMEEKERMDIEAQIAEQKALRAEAKKRYGSDWSRMFKGAKSGIDWDSVKFKLAQK